MPVALSDDYMAGFAAWDEGIPFAQCPDDVDREEWERGWQDNQWEDVKWASNNGWPESQRPD
jgi:hypothetical protein